MKNLLSLLTLLALASCGSGGGSTPNIVETPTGLEPVLTCADEVYNSDPANGCDLDVVTNNGLNYCIYNVTETTCDKFIGKEMSSLVVGEGLLDYHHLSLDASTRQYSFSLVNYTYNPYAGGANVIKTSAEGLNGKGLVFKWKEWTSIALISDYEIEVNLSDNPGLSGPLFEDSDVNRKIGFFRRYRLSQD